MKKVLLLVSILVIACVASFWAGRGEGMRHVIEDAYYSIDQRNSTAIDNCILLIDIDGELYEEWLLQ